MTSAQTTEESDQGDSSDASVQKREDWLSQKKDELEDVIQQLEEVIRIKELAIDRLTKELGDVRDQSALLEGQRTKSLDQKEDRIEELEEALRESVRITADREVALDAETQQRTILDQKVLLLFVKDVALLFLIAISYSAVYNILDFFPSCSGGAARAAIAIDA